MAEVRETHLMFVDGKVQNSNKYYNMFPAGNEFTVKYGRMGNSPATASYPIHKWNSIYNSKIRKGYKDITDLKTTSVVVNKDSGNSDFDYFFNEISKYTKNYVRNTYQGNGATKAQMDEAQKLIDLMSNEKKIDDFNDMLMELFKVIPRVMGNVSHYLANSGNDINRIINREQNSLDSMDSSNIIHSTNPYHELGINFTRTHNDEYEMLEKLLYPTKGHNNVIIHRAYKISNDKRDAEFNDWVSSQDNQSTEYLIHGTRNPNVISILKSGLMIRPSNAAVISGAAYGNGIYHSAHTAKSLNYTGYDMDKIFLIQNVHLGNPFVYNGWYRDGKSISRNEMNYDSLKKKGHHSLFVKAGDGLLNSEYIVYKEEQTITSYLVWLK